MNKNGQSIVEYALIAILVILGIVYMGPYVLRSINAHFKLWDVGVQDSVEENLNQAPASDVPPINIGSCQCTTHSACGGSVLGSSACPPDQMETDLDCTPQGCNYGDPSIQEPSQCQPDPSCCDASPWVNVGCGTLPLNQPETSPPTNCHYGEEIQEKQCNGSIQCGSLGSNCPMPQCQAFTLYPGSFSYCPGAQSGLNQNTNIVFVGNNSTNCNFASPCQVYCNSPYVVNSSNTDCTCAPPVCYGYHVYSGKWGGKKSFMNTYVMWAADNKAIAGMATTYTRTITVPPGAYSIRIGIDNHGYMELNGNPVYCNVGGNIQTSLNGTFLSPVHCSIILTASTNTFTLVVTNNLADGSSWSSNPGGVAMELGTGAIGKFKPLNPPIDTTQVSDWLVNVACPLNEFWDCSASQCENYSSLSCLSS